MDMPSRDWFSETDYWEANRSFIWPRKRLEMSETAVGYITALLGMKPGEAVLDLACGFGRHSLALSRLGYRVTGVDLNPGFIAEASAEASATGADARFLCADMREFVEAGAFHHIIIMYNSFGYFRDRADDAKVIANCHRSLRPGGRLLVQTATRELIRAFRPSGHSRYWHEQEDGTIRLEESSVDPQWTWNTTRWILLRGDERREYLYGLRLYGTDELTGLLSSSGFSSIVPYGDLTGKPCEQGREFLTLVAEKR